MVTGEAGDYERDGVQAARSRPEEGINRRHGYDHNFEYRIYGSFVGSEIYDPNSNFMVPEFRITKYELISENPGFLFYPGEEYNPRRLPIKHPPFP